MDEDVFEKYRLAGKIATEARNYGAGLINSGVSFLEVAEKIESKITDAGAKLAFPVNISLNEIAAHFSPRHDEDIVFKKGDVVKLDVGTHIDGYIADTALTVEVGTHKYDNMIKAVDAGLDVAIEMMKPDVNLSKLGQAVQVEINSYGFKPVDNLTGHSLKQYVLHAGMNIPSVPDFLNKSKPKVGDVLAIEPFATDGAGHVVIGAGSNIYLCNRNLRSKIVRDNRVKTMFSKLVKEFRTLPFAERWSNNIIENNDNVLRRLTFLGLLKHYPQLIDAKKGIVTQKEHTVIITEDGCEVTT
ncbi:MAG: type II methionyl aminopeptidase [Thermoplasmata archaeon M9B1D]|nr:MAG: type II methionyl aminopeptidase [Thermoplasmata archaeon M9B1D]PNX51516.1 MAG: type II methionyl aminopeptidase [Thermoplasmata archaeon M8B2D]